MCSFQYLKRVLDICVFSVFVKFFKYLLRGHRKFVFEVFDGTAGAVVSKDVVIGAIVIQVVQKVMIRNPLSIL